jgi:hypothetical protein
VRETVLGATGNAVALCPTYGCPCKKNFRRSQTVVLSAALGTPTCVHRGLVGLGSRVAPRISSA